MVTYARKYLCSEVERHSHVLGADVWEQSALRDAVIGENKGRTKRTPVPRERDGLHISLQILLRVIGKDSVKVTARNIRLTSRKRKITDKSTHTYVDKCILGSLTSTTTQIYVC